MLFYYIRHGQPFYSPDALTEYGQKQANALAKRLMLYGLDEIYSSTSTRAIQTAQPTCKLLQKEPTLLDWAHEELAWQEFVTTKAGFTTWFFNDREYVEQFSDKSMRDLGDNWLDHPCFANTKARSGYERIKHETDLFFERLGFKHNHEKGGYEVIMPNAKRVALFAHQGFGMVFLSILLGIPYPLFCTKFDMGHSGVSVIYFDETKKFTYPKLLQLSNDSHLYKDNILNGYQGRIDI